MENQGWKVSKIAFLSIIVMLSHFVASLIGSVISILGYVFADISTGALKVANGGMFMYKGETYDAMNLFTSTRYLIEPAVLASIIAAPITIALIFAICKVVKEKFFEFNALNNAKPLDIGMGVIIGFVLNPVLSYIMAATSLNQLSETTNILFENMFENTHFVVLLIGMAICAPIVEELMFRGVIQSSLNKVFKPSIAIIVQAVLFGAYHGNLQQFIYATMIGILFGIMRHWSKSLWTVIAAHVGFNASAVILVEISKHEDWWINKVLTNTPDIVIAAVSLVIFGILLYFFERRCRKNNKNLI